MWSVIGWIIFFWCGLVIWNNYQKQLQEKDQSVRNKFKTYEERLAEAEKKLKRKSKYKEITEDTEDSDYDDTPIKKRKNKYR
jgi:hypothetical protein